MSQKISMLFIEHITAITLFLFVSYLNVFFHCLRIPPGQKAVHSTIHIFLTLHIMLITITIKLYL